MLNCHVASGKSNCEDKKVSWSCVFVGDVRNLDFEMNGGM